MPKLKTHKGIAKTTNVRPGGTVTIGHPGHRHNTGLRSTSNNRKGRKASIMSHADLKRIKNVKF